ncbi:MAG: STAS domain-containing protein [Phycisphaerae bacterium]|nr:STAS domain-containing protein [Phycisphaerae bacterium]
MLQTEQLDEMLVVKPDGDIVASALESFRKELQGLIEQGHVNLAIDLDGVGIIDSKGLAIFMLCHKSLTAKGGRLVVLTGNEDFKQLFHVMRMDEHFTVAGAL